MKIIIFALIAFLPFAAFGAQEDFKNLGSSFAMGAAEDNILKEDNDMKKLILKYDAAPAAQKPAIKKDIEKLQLKKEEEAIKRAELRLKRQQAKIEEIKKNLQDRKKNKTADTAKRVEYLISADSVKKLKEESLNKKVIDKIKDKR